MSGGKAGGLPRPDPDFDRRMMGAALALGRRNLGRAWPNPSVGAIVVRDDGTGPVVVGRGVTAAGGRPHAEPHALAEAGAAARGATLYVTLEPCSHASPRGGPCAIAVREAGIARLVSAIEDPNPKVAGDGHRLLTAAGVAVETGVRAAEARRDHAGHIRRVRDGRPHVRLKLAVSADRMVGRAGAGQVAISGPAARRWSHGLRAASDAIMIGIGTALADDPRLDCRLPGLAGRSPVRVVLDRLARLPLGSNLVATAREIPLWVVASVAADPTRIARLTEAGASVILVGTARYGRLDLGEVLVALAGRGLTTIIAEGGPTLAAGLVAARLVDEVLLVRSDLTVGAGGIPALPGRGLDDLMADPTFVSLGDGFLGPDRLVHLWRQE